MLLLAILPTALAGAPTLDEVTLRYTTPLRVAGEGDELHLVDQHGDEVPTDDALVMLGREDDARTWARTKATRIALGSTLASVGAVSGLLTLGVVTDPETEVRDEGAVASGVILAAFAGGSGVLLLGTLPRRHLGAWMDAPTVERGIAARNAALGDVVRTASGETVPSIVAEARERRALAPYVLQISPDGRVLDGRGREFSAHELAGLWGDRVWLGDIAAQDRVDGLRWITLGAVGGGVAALGCIAGVGGILTHYAAFGDPVEQHRADGLMLGAGITGASGLALAGAGVGGWIIADAWHDEPRFWFSERVLAQEVERHNAALQAAAPTDPPPTEPASSEPASSEPASSEPARSEPAPAEPLPRPIPLPAAPGRGGGTSLHVVPLVGPIVGIAGTF